MSGCDGSFHFSVGPTKTVRRRSQLILRKPHFGETANHVFLDFVGLGYTVRHRTAPARCWYVHICVYINIRLMNCKDSASSEAGEKCVAVQWKASGYPLKSTFRGQPACARRWARRCMPSRDEHYVLVARRRHRFSWWMRIGGYRLR